MKTNLKSEKVPQDEKLLEEILVKLNENIKSISSNLSNFLKFYQDYSEYKYFLLKKINENYFIENTLSYNEFTTFDNILKKSQRIFSKQKIKEKVLQMRENSEAFKKNQTLFNKFKETVDLHANDKESKMLGSKRQGDQFDMLDEKLSKGDIQGEDTELTKNFIKNNKKMI